MPIITWRDANGSKTSIEVDPGANLMRAAVAAGIDGIYGDCGGALACATCHVVPDSAWAERVGPAGVMEDEMLDMVEGQRMPTSRLSCQLQARDDLDGLILDVPVAS
jgi:2Fe-2S ferredoxin